MKSLNRRINELETRVPDQDVDFSKVSSDELKKLLDHAENGIIDSDKINDPEILAIMEKIEYQ